MHPRKQKIKRKSSDSYPQLIDNILSDNPDKNSKRFPIFKQRKNKEMSDHKEFFIQNDNNSNSAVKHSDEKQNRPQYLSENSIETLDINSVTVATKSQWQAILNGITSEDDDTLRLQCLMELCNHLVVLTEEHLNGFKVDQFIPPLVSILQTSQDPNILLFVCRAFSHLLEALPISVGHLIRNRAIPALCEKLLAIEYIDLAEQVINTLLKISEIQNGAIEILKSGGLTALLTYLDFFSIDIQYKAIQTAANALSIIPNDCFDIVRDSIGLFNQLLDHQDVKILTNACISVYKIIKALSSSKKDLYHIRDLGIVTKLINILSIHSNNLDNDDTSITDYAMRALTIMANKDGTLIHLLFKHNLPLTLHQMFEYEKKRNIRQKVKHVQSLYYIICLIDAMLPEKDSSKIVVQPRYYYFEKIDEEENAIKIQEYEKNPKYVKTLVQHLLKNLVEIYGVRSSISLNQKCLSSIYKMIVVSSDEILREELKDLSFSSFIVRLLGLKDVYPLMMGLYIGENLMEKLPEIFRIYFVREGVINEINQLIESNRMDNIEEDPEESDDVKRKRTIFLKASEFKMKYFSNDEKIQTEELKMFHDIAGQIKEMNSSPYNMEAVENTMNKLLSYLNEGISTYELLKSGLIESLLEFLTFDDKSLPQYDCKRIRDSRIKAFQNIFLSEDGKTALVNLLNECQHGIEKLDNFEGDTISVHDNPIGCLKYLTRQFTFKLVPHENETMIRENILVHAEPLATMKDVKSYLKNKLDRILDEKKNQPLDSELSMEEEDNVDEEDNEAQTNEELQEEEEENEHMDEELDEEEGEHPYEFLEEDEEEEEEEYLEEDEEDEEGYEDYDHVEEEEDVVDLSEIEKFKHRMKESKDMVSKVQQEGETSSEEISKKNIKLFFKGVEIDENFNVFKTVYMMNKQSDQSKQEFRGIYRYWTNRYEIEYLHVDEQEEVSFNETKSNDYFIDIYHFFFNSIDESVEEFNLIEKRNPLNNLLYLIKIIYTIINHTNPSHPSLSSFINDQLTTKVIRITQDPLLLCTGVLPDWIFDLLSHHRHLFTLDVRTHYFRSTSLGISRTFLALKERLEDFMKFRLGRVYRQKVRIHRNKILESAFVIFKKISSSSILEIEYFDEVATGLGPTLEFFTLLSHEFQKKNLNLWVDRSSHESVIVDGKELCYHPSGLFPRPSLQNEFEGNDNMKKLLYYNFGCFIAKAIVDQRLIDVHLSNPLIKFLLGEPLTIYSLNEIFPEICQVIKDFNEIVNMKNQIINNDLLTSEEKESKINELTYKNAKIEDLSLYFVLPGLDIPLIENGDEILVTINNLEEYVNRMIQVITKESINQQMDAIKEGFNSVFDSKRLRIFTPTEIDTMIYGSSESDQEWDKETILENTICDHGYTPNSRAIKYIVEIMSEFTSEERRKFLRFITGSPRLPPGGFKGLSPKLTFVRKEEEPPFKPDNYLPSVNTCFLYLKLPDYSSKEIMKENLLKAIEHGQSGFSLS